MSKITPEHLARQAVVYIRQSTADQVINNKESQRRQHGLADRARQLGWSEVIRQGLAYTPGVLRARWNADRR
ncbi:DNA invertase Pin-like site-specific DNA recombinase [Bradyrhizobium sp. USDA 4461]